MKEKNIQLAKEILSGVGGKENIISITNCMTRVRFNLKDASIVNEEKLKQTNGVLGVVKAAGQTQIIVGMSADKICAEICKLSGNQVENISIVNGDQKDHQKLSIKKIGMGILDGLSGSLTPIIPVMLTASMFKMLAVVLGPGLIGILSIEGDLYKLFNIVGDAGFYFFPLLLGYTSAKKFNTSPVMGIFLGGILLHPTMVEMATQGTAFSVFGITCSVQNYSSTLLPIVMSVFVMSYVEHFFKKYIPESLKIMFVPLLTIIVMLPVSLCVLGPAGAFLGKYISHGIIIFSNTFGFLGAAVIGAFWEFLVMTGMHQVMITQIFLVFSEVGYDPVITLGAIAASLSVPGMCLGMALVLKNKEEKGLSISYVVASLIGGVTEPGLYGVGMRYRKPFIGMMAGGFAGALYAGLLGVKAYALVPVASFLTLSSFAGGNLPNLINGVISGVIAFSVSAIVTYLICKEKRNKSDKELYD